jgi:N-dimethylarginine dimethylaminohydrolase
MKDLVSTQVFRHAVGLCFRRSFLLQSFSEANRRTEPQSHFV